METPWGSSQQVHWLSDDGAAAQDEEEGEAWYEQT